MGISKKALEELNEHPLVEKVDAGDFFKDVKWGPNTYKRDFNGIKLVGVYTKELVLRNKSNNNYRRVIGKAKLGLYDPQSTNVRGHDYPAALTPYVAFEEKEGSGEYVFFYEGYFHVHVFSSGQFCMGGNHAYEMAKELQAGNLLSVVDFCIEFLQHRSDGYGDPYPFMAKKQIQKKTKDGWVDIDKKDLPPYVQI